MEASTVSKWAKEEEKEACWDGNLSDVPQPSSLRQPHKGNHWPCEKVHLSNQDIGGLGARGNFTEEPLIGMVLHEAEWGGQKGQGGGKGGAEGAGRGEGRGRRGREGGREGQKGQGGGEGRGKGGAGRGEGRGKGGGREGEREAQKGQGGGREGQKRQGEVGWS